MRAPSAAELVELAFLNGAGGQTDFDIRFRQIARKRGLMPEPTASAAAWELLEVALGPDGAAWNTLALVPRKGALNNDLMAGWQEREWALRARQGGALPRRQEQPFQWHHPYAPRLDRGLPVQPFADNAPQSGSMSFINESTRSHSQYGVNFFRTSRIRSEMSQTGAGRRVLQAADNGEIDLIFNSHPTYGDMAVPRDLYGRMTRGYPGQPNTAEVFLANTQNGIEYPLLGLRSNGYQAAAGTATHEGLHALGIAGSRRAEALVRLAELEQMGVRIDARAMRQVLQDMRATGGYNQPWRVGGSSPLFPGLEW